MNKLTPDRVTQELNKIIDGRNPHIAIELMSEMGVLGKCLAVPEVAQGIGNDDDKA